MRLNRPFQKDRLKFYNIICCTPSPSFMSKLKICLSNFGLHSIAVYRFGRISTALYNKNHFLGFLFILLYKILNFFIQTIHHVTIVRDADIGPGFMMMHYYSIVIGPAKIGSNLIVHHNLTIGQAVARLDHSIPEIGDNVWIGPHCVITGGIRIGNGVTISAGTILSKDVPDNCLVAGNPGRVIMHNYDNRIMAIRKQS